MRGPTSGEVTDSMLFEQAWGRPIGHRVETPSDKMYRLRRANTDNCGNCGQQVTWAWLEGVRRALDSDGEELDLTVDGKTLRAVPGVTYGIHVCR